MFPEFIDLSNPDLIYAFKSSVSVPAMTAGFAGLLFSTAAFAGVAVPGVARLILPNPAETRLSDNLPFMGMASDNKTIICKDGTISQLIEVAGRDVTFFSAGQRDAFTNARKNWIDQISEISCTVRVFVIRDKVPVLDEVVHDNKVLHEMAKKWSDSFQESYRNRQVIMVSHSGKSKKAMEILGEAVDTTVNTLSAYAPRIMSQLAQNAAHRPLTILARLVSPLTRPQPTGAESADLSEVLVADQVEFGGENGLIQFRSGAEKMYCAAIGIRRLGDETNEGFAVELSALPCELIVLNNIEPISRAKSSLILNQQSRMTLSSRFSMSVAAQFHEAQELVDGNAAQAASLAYYAQTIFIFSKDPDKLREYERDVKRIANAYGITPVREGAVGHASWFSMFPGFTSWPRRYKIMSYNVANQITLDRPPEGLPRSDWGEGPITYFRTATGSAYSFQFHVSMDTAAVAHGVTIGPTGGGKTTLITFLSAMAMRHKKLRVYMIDRFGGAYIFTNAVGGTYATFDGSDMRGTHSALNPFQMPDTVENRAFLRNFLQAISNAEDPDSLEEISFAVEALYDMPGLPKDQRSLVNVFNACFSKSKPLRKNLEKWVEPSMLGNLFNAPHDTLDLTSNRLVTLDFTKIYENDDVARAVILYLMHRIQASINELKCPALIFIDETEPIVQHPMFRKFYLQMLQEYRKKGAAVISAFQRPEAITQAGLGEAIRGQAQTTYFLQNPQAQYEEYADWNLTDSEWAYIKGNLPAARRLQRSILVKRATGESVILDVDLKPLGQYLRIFSSDEPSKALAETMMDEHGGDWLNYYLNS